MFSTTMKLALLLASCSGIQSHTLSRRDLSIEMIEQMSNVCKVGQTMFAAHGGAAVNFYGLQSSVNGGAVGVSPGDSITGFDGVPVTSALAATFAAKGLADHTAFTNVNTPNDDVMGVAVELGGATFTPGVHRAATSITISENTQVTLKGEGDYLFQAGTTLITGAGANFVLQNAQGGAGDPNAFNIVWVLGTAATLGDNCIVPGTITAGSAITINAGSGVTGCAIAQSAVVFTGNGCANCPQ